MGFGNPFHKVADITKALVPGQKDYLDFGGDPASHDGGGLPTFKKKSTQDLIDAITLGEATGIGDTNRLKKLLEKRGLTWEGANPEDIKASFDLTDPQEVDFNRVSGILNNSSEYGRASVARKKWDAFKADLLDKKLKDYFGENVQPTFDKVKSQLDEMLAKPSFGADELASTRSEMTSAVRTQEAQRLRRVAATLGLRGMDPGSVAGAALVQQQAEETDRALMEALRRYGLDVTDQERSAQAQELGLANNLSQSMFGAKSALETSDWERLAGINSDIGSILEAANSLEASTKAAADAARLGFYGNVASGVAQGAGSALGG